MLSQELLSQLIKWRHQIHQHPETAFEEVTTSQFVAQKLKEAGLDVHQGLAKTGVVGTLKKGTSNRSIALRADLDALDVIEENQFSHCSHIHGKMHACGHDGHTVMLLGAATYLAEHGQFDGTIYFIFQPAEENLAGGKDMIDDGLFDLFPADAVYGMHNWPGLDVGQFAVMDTAMMASNDVFEIKLSTKKSGHAAMPHKCQDTISAASQLVSQINQIVSRNINAMETAVISVTKISGGTTHNILPENTEVWGTVRAFSSDTQELIEQRLRDQVKGIAQSFNLEYEFKYDRRYCATINHPEHAGKSRQAILATTQTQAVTLEPSMASEDFGFMLQAKPGCFAWIGNGNTEALHNSKYDFNDKSLPIGVQYWINLTEQELS